MIGVHLCEHLLSFAREARDASSNQLSLTQLVKLNKEIRAAPAGSELASGDWRTTLQLEEAEALWAWDERTLAIKTLQNYLVDRNRAPGFDPAQVLCLLGKFTGAEKVRSIIPTFLCAR